jgi:hypothetical protein
MDDIDRLIDDAASIVARDMERRPVSARDGIWRFDRALRDFFGETRAHPREFWIEIYNRAFIKNAGKDTWDSAGYGIVASFAQTIAAYATPGFIAARRDYMT